MKRTTHMMMGAAAGVLVAAPSSVPVMLGAVWLGVAGGGFPDWLDLRSELRGSLRLRHRGFSHSLIFVALVTTLTWLALSALAAMPDMPAWLSLTEGTARLWTLAFATGMLTHLAGDACTHAGIRPLLPLSGMRFWVLPRWLRGRSDGFLNVLALLVSLGGIGLVLVWRVATRVGAI